VTHVQEVKASDNPKTVGEVDVILSCVKLWDLESSAELMMPMIGRNTMVIPLQNGVDASEVLSAIIGEEHILGGVAMVTGSIVRPGVVHQTGKHHSIIFGELNGEVSARVEAFRDAGKAAGIDAVVPESIQVARWNKFIGLAAMAGICCLMRQSVGPLRDDPDVAPLIQSCMREIVDVGIACSVPLEAALVDNWVNLFRSLPAGVSPSMLVDLKAGRRLELRWLTGKVVELGRVHGVPTPVNSVIYAALKPYADGQPS
jgi:2-dehydropantoate 2-reductase